MKAFLTLITENQFNKSVAIELAENLKDCIGERCIITEIDTYYKFKNSYKIELEVFSKSTDNKYFILEGISITDKICSPWFVYFDDSNDSAELIFNKDPNSQFRKKQFESIRWGHWQTTTE